jgi:hypothetical protein
MKTKTIALGLAMAFLTIDSAFAGFFTITPKPGPTVPEIDSGGGIAAIAVLVSLAAIFVSKLRSAR